MRQVLRLPDQIEVLAKAVENKGHKVLIVEELRAIKAEGRKAKVETNGAYTSKEEVWEDQAPPMGVEEV